jgi:sulfite exporter TauE/SafE
MTFALWGSIVVAGLLGSLHCAAMCGPFAATYAGGQGSTRWLAHAAYHGGRLFTYSALGAAAGGLGRALDLAGEAAGLARAAGVVAGATLLSWGLLKLLRTEKLVPLRTRAPSSLLRFPIRLMASFAEQPPVLRSGLLGLSSALLPCGWLYAFAAGAAGTASAASGAALMAALWLGTLPMLLGVGLSLHALGTRLRRHVPRLGAAALVVVGLLTLFGRLELPAFAGEDVPPCHRNRASHGAVFDAQR